MNESGYIYKIINLLVDAGWSVEPFCPQCHRGGRCHYPHEEGGALIEINEPVARDALFTLAHEAGHAFSYLEIPDYLSLPVWKREDLAWDRGWLVLTAIGADALISREEWDLDRGQNHGR